MNISLCHREVFERVGVIVRGLSVYERVCITELLEGYRQGTPDERSLAKALEDVGGAEMLRIAIRAVNAGQDPADAILDRIERV